MDTTAVVQWLDSTCQSADDIKKALQMEPSEPYLYVLRARLNKLRFNERDKERDLQLAEKYGISRKMALIFMK